MRKSTFRLIQPVIVLHLIVLMGTVGYMMIEKMPLLDALYMTTISITTVGYSEIHPLSDAGRIFTIFLLVTSWATFAFAIARITQFIISGELNKYFKTRRLMRNIDKLAQHVIICGYGRNGHQAARTLKAHGVPFMVIEKDKSLIEKSETEGEKILLLEGDSTDDDILRQAGVERARALITTLPVDAQNVFIVLSARSLNPTIRIISRASENASVPKMKKAGADNVIMPDHIGGTQMATLISKPDVVEFIDFISGEEGQSIQMESISFEDLPKTIQGKTLVEIMNWRKTGANCIGIKSIEGKFQINPPENTPITNGMKIIILGTKAQIMQLKDNLSL